MPQLDPTWFASQIFWLVIAFSVLYFVLAKLSLPPLMEMVAGRKQAIAQDLEQAQRLKSQAEHARHDYERMLVDARLQAQKLVDDAMAEYEETAERQMQAMDAAVAHQLDEASRRINAKKQALLDALAPASSELASMIVEKLTRRTPNNEQVSRIINELSKQKRVA